MSAPQITPAEVRIAVEIACAHVGPNTAFVLRQFVAESIAARFPSPVEPAPTAAPRVWTPVVSTRPTFDEQLAEAKARTDPFARIATPRPFGR